MFNLSDGWTDKQRVTIVREGTRRWRMDEFPRAKVPFEDDEKSGKISYEKLMFGLLSSRQRQRLGWHDARPAWKRAVAAAAAAVATAQVLMHI